MPRDNPYPVARIADHPIHTMLAPVPFVCFLATLVTDIVYAVTADMQWANFSAWLLTAGLVVSVLVVIAGLIDFALDRSVRSLRATWVHAVGDGLALALAIVNVLVHSRDAYTSVVPEGLALSALVVLILVIVGWNDRAMTTCRRAVGEERP